MNDVSVSWRSANERQPGAISHAIVRLLQAINKARPANPCANYSFIISLHSEASRILIHSKNKAETLNACSTVSQRLVCVPCPFDPALSDPAGPHLASR